jgi:hypothetical protein
MAIDFSDIDRLTMDNLVREPSVLRGLLLSTAQLEDEYARDHFEQIRLACVRNGINFDEVILEVMTATTLEKSLRSHDPIEFQGGAFLQEAFSYGR